MNNNDQQNKTFLHWPLLIAAATPLAYFYAFTYEAGYVSYFGMPQELITLSLTTIILNLSYYVLALIMLFFLVNIFYMIVSDKLSKVRHHNIPGLVALILALFHILIKVYSRGFDNTTLIFIGMVFILFFAVYLLPLLMRKIKLSCKNIPSNIETVDGEVPDIIVLLRNKYGAKVVFNIFIYFFILFLIPQTLIYNIGYRAARIQEYYLVLSGNNDAADMAIIKIYNDMAIMAPFKRITKETYPEFLVVDVNKIGTTMKLENIGPLIPQDSQSHEDDVSKFNDDG